MKIIITLSQTFYTIGDNKTLIYLQDKIRNNSIFGEISLWESILDFQIEDSVIIMFPVNSKKTNKKEMNRLKNENAFHIMTSFLQIMEKFKGNKDEVKKVLDWASLKYSILDGDKKLLNYYIENPLIKK